jgi:ketosteroid isomerase-like protein
MNSKEQLIQTFYTAFNNGDIETMAKCYHKNIVFEDPAFGKIHAEEVNSMWKMLIERSKGDLKIDVNDIVVVNNSGQANWIATYNFSQTKRKVVNKIHATFEFEDDLILIHKDSFDLWEWSKQALGLKGYLLGWTGFMRNKIQTSARLSLKNYMKK